MTAPTAYAVLAELVAIREWDHRTMLAASEYDEFCARCDAAYAAARACVAAGPGSDALLRFAGECLDPWPECLCDLEGEMQERLHKAGLIEARVATEAGDDYDVGDTVYSLTELGLAAMTAKRDEELAVCDQAVGRLDDVRAALAAMTASLDDVRAVVNEQADDPALWLIQPTITEEYLQRALRRLHAVIDAAIAKGAA